MGASGVVVNLGFLFLFADLLGIHNNVASAMAIELSVLSNLALNELWTFSDRRPAGSFVRRALKFHVVSGVGALGQLLIFVAANVVWMFLIFSPEQVDAWLAGGNGVFDTYLLRPISAPPDVGALKYLSQLMGIAGAVLWNFLANFYWTWRSTDEETP